MAIVSFADLTHTGAGITANNNPLAVGYIAAYAKAHLGDAIDARLFKYPSALSRFLARETPTIACFTNYMWNEALSCAYAGYIKRHHPRTVVVMGGPNYPIDASEQKAYLQRHPETDFFVDGEGEISFISLFEALRDIDFDAERFKREGRRVQGAHYVIGDTMMGGEPAPRILDLSRIPSPYTTGLLDEFFDDKLTPMIQTTRGCPYSCTFCHDGIAYMNPTRAFSPDRVFEELSYVEARVKTPTLQLADLNWGMFKADLQTAMWLAEARRRSGWPRNIMVSTAKNQKERIVEMSQVLGDALQVGASVQSTDTDVLKNIKRTNISLDAIVKMAKGATDNHTGSFTELILGLPGDTVEKHTKSVYDMIDAGIQDLRLFQFILLPGTEGSDLASRAKYEYRTGFRVLARCFGRYPIGDEEIWAAETQEICLGNNTMPSDDYFACRSFDLTIAVFNNGGILKEFFRMAEALGVKRSAVLQRISRMVETADPELRVLYDEFKEAEAKNFFPTRAALDAFLERPGAIDEYLSGVYGVNHIYKARTTALMSLFAVLARISHEAVTIELRARGFLDPLLSLYLDELLDVTIARKSQLTDLSRSTELTLHFDFFALHNEDYLLDPRRVYVPNGIRFLVRHTEVQQTDLRKYYAQYGEGFDGIGQFLQRNDSHLSAVLYRALEYACPVPSADIAQLVPTIATAS
jgi:radical SAM superfamily enzyme YgiQ (UPF0313 family)